MMSSKNGTILKQANKTSLHTKAGEMAQQVKGTCSSLTTCVQSLEPHGGRREPIPQSCPLMSKHMVDRQTHTHTQ